MNQETKGVEVTLEAGKRTAKALTFTYRIRNGGDQPLYLYQGQRMPYTRVDDAHSVRLAMSLNPQPEGLDFLMVEIPLTRTLAPGQSEAGRIEVKLPIQQSDHFFQPHPPATPPAGKVAFRLEVGLSDRPVTAKDRPGIGYSQLLQGQRLLLSEPVLVDL